MDTIFASSPPPSDIERDSRVKAKTKKRSSPRKRHQLELQESTDQECMEPVTHALLHRQASDMVVDDLTGNIAQMPDSVILDIESTDSSFSDRVDDDVGDIEDDNDEEDDEDGDGEDEADEGEWLVGGGS